ncbi:uncharacterized protein [Dysidea avara]|uniref:uncharacterized protein isoform X2 n=1 Tax=Dysidea avara TaxID=196820 RepID=UPI0033294418
MNAKRRKGHGRMQKAIRTIRFQRVVPTMPLETRNQTPKSALGVPLAHSANVTNTEAVTSSNAHPISANVAYRAASPITASITYNGALSCNGPITASVTYTTDGAVTPDATCTPGVNTATVMPTVPSPISANVTYTTSGAVTQPISDCTSTGVNTATAMPTVPSPISANVTYTTSGAVTQPISDCTSTGVNTATAMPIVPSPISAACDLDKPLSTGVYSETPAAFDFEGFEIYLRATFPKTKPQLNLQPEM